MISGDIFPRLLDGKIWDGEANLRAVAMDLDVLGKVLSCHLILEHHLDLVLKLVDKDLDWDEARLTFAQKLALFPSYAIDKKTPSFVPAIRHLNKLRNKFGHNIDATLTADDVLPLLQYLQKSGFKLEGTEFPEEPVKILMVFTSYICLYLHGFLMGAAHAINEKKAT